MTNVSADTAASVPATDIIERYRRDNRRTLVQLALLSGVIILCWYLGELLSPQTYIDGLPAIGQLIVDSVPPDFARWQQWIMPLVDTLVMSIAGTALAVLFSLPLGFLAAANTSPNRVVFQVSRLVLNGLRAVPELIMGIIFVAAVGFGILPGALAVGLHSIGMVGKFFAESIEHVDEQPVEAARAAGASGFQVLYHGILPQVLPQFADVSIYRWEYNFRASTVMGMVGAGGIGFELMSSLRIMDYQQVSAILLVILVMVTLVDSLSGHLRRYFK
ncbi:phosphonate transport system permease protein [Methylohalomonas lacus]|uniref:Phosphonate transport system permease protein n=1 Tax=Methylohalomonas lacus TaxID=398773 RepID=A0AAE3HIS5_9GAMM|nr:phosphonate ABC transporter, permease protein PhnE [Methylohalomonas lacus]MCS3903141.1 phosphonate transport system permease protein [Methylohalomonas lacus]